MLTLRAARLPGTPWTNVAFAVSALLWSAGGLLYAMMRASGMPRADLRIAHTLQLAGSAIFPIPVLHVWRSFAQKVRGAWIPVALAYFSAAAIVILGIWSPQTIPLRLATAYNAAILFVLGAAIYLRRSSTPRAIYAPSLVLVLCIAGAAVAMGLADRAPRFDHQFDFIGVHLLLVVVLCAFLVFARFRYADVFIRYGMRILLAAVWAGVLSYMLQLFFAMQITRHTSISAVGHTLGVVLGANLILLAFTFLDERLSSGLTRLLFHSADYRKIVRDVSDKLRTLRTEAEIANAIETAARIPLELRTARVVQGEQTAGMIEGDVVEVSSEQVLVPIASGGKVTHALLIEPGASRPGLVSDDFNFLRTLAAQCGSRFDALSREYEAAERESREAVLRQQVSEAELRALRAQINPHFLFNSLNTIADLVAVDPAGAEAMTLQLASVFRHVLAHSPRPLTPLRDEIAFLRTYLAIEQVRFRDRLKVDFEIAPEVDNQQVPSLILQPVVENALKHGLGPKPGPGRLWIRAFADGSAVRIMVEDDGMGPKNGIGLGLTNVAERLKTLYQDSAGVRLEPREGGGARVTIWVPRSEIA